MGEEGHLTRRQHRERHRFGSFILDLDRGFLLCDEREVPLRPKVFELLRHLVLNHGRLVTKDELVSAVWPDASVTDNSLAQCLFELRRALGDEAQVVIRTVARRGYVFEAPTTIDSAMPPALPSTEADAAGPDAGSDDEIARRGAPSKTGTPLLPRWALFSGMAGLAIITAAAVTVLRTNTSAVSTVEPPVQLTNFNDSAVSPALSNDGRMLAFLRGGYFGTTAAPRGQVYLKVLPDGEPVQLTNDPSAKDRPMFSPDDSRLVYTSSSSGLSWDSWQVPVRQGSPRPFLKNVSGVTWLGGQRLLFSTIMSGVHMGVATSLESGLDYREIYFPGRDDGMVHRSAASPDGKSLLLVEMTGGTWRPCRLVPADGSSPGRQVSPPDGQCTSAAWSPDGRWMYFSSNAGGAFHIWRQRFPDSVPEQITFGPTEQEGTAVTADGKYLITSMGLQQAGIWLHDGQGERPLTAEGFATQPAVDPSGKRVYYLARSSRSRGQTSGELWTVDLASGIRERLLPGFIMTNFAVSKDGQMLAFASVGHEAGDGVWVANMAGREVPRRLARGTDLRAFFGGDGEVVYSGEDSRLHRIRVDGSEDTVLSDEPVSYLSTVSPDGRWAVVIRPAKSASAFTSLEFRSLRGERSFAVCNDDCSVGPRSFLASPAFTWSHDGTRLQVNLAHFGKTAMRSVSLPYRTDGAPEVLWPKGLRIERDIEANPDAVRIPAGNTFPGPTPGSYLIWRGSTLSNLYKIRIPDAD